MPSLHGRAVRANDMPMGLGYCLGPAEHFPVNYDNGTTLESY
jgi:hypothetical protein